MTDRVLITAGASGVGRAMVDGFAATGARVAVCDVDEAALAALAADRPDTSGTAMDVTDEAATAELFARLDRDWGGLDVVCANAGISGPTAAVEDISLADWQRCLAVNLDAAFLAAKYAAPLMKRQESGAMILTSSTAGLHGYPWRSPYAAAKWAVIGLAKSLAMELGPHGIRANAICPGSVKGPRMDGVISREAAAKGVSEEVLRDGYASGTSMRTFIEGSDIAEMAVFLASPRARYISGQALSVDGHVFNPDP